MGYIESKSCYFWLEGSKHLPVLKDSAKWIRWLLLCWLVESEREEKERRKIAFQRKKSKNFLDPQSILFEPFENLNKGLPPPDVSGASKEQSTLSFKSFVLLRACLYHPSTGFFFKMGCWSWMLTQLLKHQNRYALGKEGETKTCKKKR
jgi:hypothetical protein